MRRIIVSVIFTAMALGVALQAADTKFGAGVTITKATPIKELYASPDKFVGKTLRVDGVVTAVCTDMGCWLALGAADNPDQAVRFQAEHDGKIVFPLTMKGKPASAEGVFVKIGDGDKELVEITFGVVEGETYAAENSFIVKAEMAKGTAEHVH